MKTVGGIAKEKICMDLLGGVMLSFSWSAILARECLSWKSLLNFRERMQLQRTLGDSAHHPAMSLSCLRPYIMSMQMLTYCLQQDVQSMFKFILICWLLDQTFSFLKPTLNNHNQVGRKKGLHNNQVWQREHLNLSFSPKAWSVNDCLSSHPQEYHWRS